MTSKAEKERQKQIQDKCQTLLDQMLRDDDNKYCVDCDAKGMFCFIPLSDIKTIFVCRSCYCLKGIKYIGHM